MKVLYNAKKRACHVSEARDFLCWLGLTFNVKGDVLEGELIVRVGIDLVEVQRIAHAMENPRFRERVLTQSEDSYCRTAHSVAGRWAAKEAVYKAIGADLGWQDVEIVNDVQGEPVATVLRAGVVDEQHRIHVSIAHERGMAVAMAIYEKVD